MELMIRINNRLGLAKKRVPAAAVKRVGQALFLRNGQKVSEDEEKGNIKEVKGMGYGGIKSDDIS